jgi:hypothetical protein
MLVFIDESGDHILDVLSMDNNYNVFVLAAICFDDNEYIAFDLAFRELKQRFFGTDNFIVHTAEITRPHKSKDPLNAHFNDKDFRALFYQEITDLINQHPFDVIACVMRKLDHLNKYQDAANDPYLFSFDNIFNRVIFTLPRHNKCKIYPEKRDNLENKRLELSFERIKTTGTKFITPHEVRSKVSEFELKDKKENISGLQVADLLVTPIGRQMMGKPPKPPGNEIPFSVVKKKITRITIFPK